MKKKLLFLIVLLVLLFSSVAFQSKAYKKEKYSDKVENRFIVTPVRYELKLKPDQNIVEKVTVVNRLGQKEDFFVEIEDFENKNGRQSLNSLVDWIRPELNKFSLDQGERIEFDLDIDVPKNVFPGGYYANLIIGNKKESNKKTNGQKIDLINRISIPLLSTVPGEFNLSGDLINFFSDKFFYLKGPVILEGNFLNKGDVHVYPESKVEVYNFLNKKIVDKNIESEVILPNHKKTWNISLDKIFIGRYKAVFTVNYGDDLNKLSKKAVFWAFPLHLLLLVIFVIYLTHFIVKKIKENYEIIKKEKSNKKI